jgi:hypothetical protein
MGTVKVRNVSYFGEIDVPSIRFGSIKPGEEIEVSAEVAALLDPAHFEAVGKGEVGKGLYPREEEAK